MADTYISEIHKLLKLGGSPDDSHIHGGPAGLPVVEHALDNDGGSHMTHIAAAPGVGAGVASIPGMQTIRIPKVNIKSLVIYPLIFLVAFAFFYVVLNFPSILAQMEGFFSPPQSQQILGSDQAAYYKWISNYFYAVGDPALLSPTNDIDHDGLSNYDEFIMHTNPIVADSSGDGISDGVKILDGMNPWGSGPMTAEQKQLVSKLDLTLINNRISAYTAQAHPGTVASASTVNFDLTRPGTLSIPKLKIQVPLIWSQDPSDFETDLTHGVIHYPGTAMPGENGVIYVAGHSSDYLWKHDPMQDIFAKLNFLSAGDDVFIDVYDKDGKVENFRYQVTGNHIYKPDDQAQFFNNSNTSILNLSTCWPIGTSTNRIVVSAVQVGL